MKKAFLSFLFFLLCIVCSAQDYLVYMVKGDVTVKKGTSQEAVSPGMVLPGNAEITLPAGAKLIVLAEKEKKLYTLKDAATEQIGHLVSSGGVSAQTLTESYLAYVKQKISGYEGNKDKNYRQSAGTSYREADSLLVKSLVTGVDTTKANDKNK